MKNSNHDGTGKSSGGIATLFNDAERKVLFRKYVVFLGWIEVLIFIICWLYQLGNDGYDRFGPIEIPFPWKSYFLISFMAPVAITFIIGLVIVGFNRYFGEAGTGHEGNTASRGGIEDFPGDKSSRTYKLMTWINWMQKLPYLLLLILLAVSAGFFYKIDAIMAFVGSVGEKSIKIMLISLASLAAVLVVFGFILIVLNYKLRKRSMEYQYRSEVAHRFGLIILDDNTVLNKDGKLLVQGKKFKNAVPMLPAGTSDISGSMPDETEEEASPPQGPIHRPVDFSTTS